MVLSGQELLSALVLGLAGSTHCMAMCGPIVASFSVGTARRGWSGLLLDGSYHGGRLLGYGIMGACCGLSGAVLNAAGLAVGLPATAGLLGGLLMIIVGLFQLLPKERTDGLSQLMARWSGSAALMKLATSAMQRGGIQAGFVLGALTAFFPCGLLFAAYGKASALAHPLAAALFMMLFALASAPGLVLIARILAVFRLSKDRLKNIAAVAILALGLVTVALSANQLRESFSRTEDTAVECPYCEDDTGPGY